MQEQPESVETNLRRYHISLHSSVLLEVQNQFFTPNVLKHSYQNILQRWTNMEKICTPTGCKKTIVSSLLTMLQMLIILCLNYNVLVSRNGF